MEDFKERLLDEYHQLKDRLEKLDSFLRFIDVTTIDKHQHFLLGTQREAMKKYLIILELRMDNLGIEYGEEVRSGG